MANSGVSFDTIAIGCFDSVQFIDLVGGYTLFSIQNFLPGIGEGLYKDDTLFYFLTAALM